MAEKHEKHEKGLLARTATYTSKKATRMTTKLKQRVGKGDETKDEVFDEFVTNFQKQQSAAARLTTELRNYLRCITAMQVAASTFGEAVKDVYDDEWSGKESLIQYFKEADSNWTYLGTRLTDEVLEPLNSYQKPFSDVKNKIHKRSRKLVDYDHSRHAVDTLRAKGATKTSDAKKLNLAEDEYQKAKDIFIDLTSELYEELPALYDSRIGFYVSCFQSVFTLEEVFHREAANVKHSLNDLLDQLIKDFSAGTYSTRKPFSAGLETTGTGSEKEDSDKLSTGSLTQFYDVAVPPTTANANDSTANDSINSKEDESDEKSNDAIDGSQIDNSKLDSDTNVIKTIENNETEQNTVPSQPVRPAPRPPPPKLQSTSTTVASNEGTTPPSRPRPPSLKDKTNNQPSEQVKSESLAPNSSENEGEIYDRIPSPEELGKKVSSVHDNNTEVDLSGAVADNVVAYKNNVSPDNENKCNLIVPASIYKVIATHSYSPEDEDELSFEKGDIIHVIPYDDPEEQEKGTSQDVDVKNQDDGWLMGVVDTNGLVGVFPENFTKPTT